MLSKQQLLAALVRAHDKCHILPSYVTPFPVEGLICMLLGAVKPAQFYRFFFFFCLSGLCPEQHRAGFVLRDEISAQNDLLTPDQTPPTASLKDCVSVLQCMAISIYSDLYSNLKLKISDVVL